MIEAIHDFYYDDRAEELSIDFSTSEDGTDFFRTQLFSIQQLEYLLPPNFFEGSSWLPLLDEEVLKDVLQQYYDNGNHLPPQQFL